MKSLFAIAATLMTATTVYGQQMIETNNAETFVSDESTLSKGKLLGSTKERTKLGAYVEEHTYENIIERSIDVPPAMSKLSDKEKAQHIREVTQELIEIQAGTKDLFKSNEEIFGCTNRLNSTDPAYPAAFLPVFLGMATPENPTFNTEGVCYKSISMTFNQTSETSFELLVDLQDKQSSLCQDSILFGNTEMTHFELFYRSGLHKITFNMPTQDEQKDVAFGGIKAFILCDSVKEEIESVMRTLQLFFDKSTSQSNDQNTDVVGLSELEQANYDFFNVSMNYELQPREIQTVEIDESMIRSGDHFGMFSLDGSSSLIMYGSGSFTDHSTMALWFDDGLYIVESNTPLITRTPYAEWIEGRRRSSMVAWSPLTDELAERFNETAAREFFLSMEGTVYGYHNLLYGWIDTAEDNWSPLIPHHFVPILMSMTENIDENGTNVIYTDALNKRLGVEGMNITQIAAIAAEQGMSIDDVAGMTEVEGWIYSGLEPKDGRAYVCSAFAAAIWEVAGLFDGFEINAPEFTPGNAYQMKFFKTERPQACIDADPELEFCQIEGAWRMVLPGYNTIEPYDHMNENCPTIAPEYYRPDGC